MENYRSAMSKMAEDIIVLRTQVVTLEAENSQLHMDLSLHQDLGRGLLDDTDTDVMTKAELADRIGKPQQSNSLFLTKRSSAPSLRRSLFQHHTKDHNDMVSTHQKLDSNFTEKHLKIYSPASSS